MKLNKAQMHKRPTYETLVKDTILEPKDKIALPDRAATILRKTQQLTRYDDAEFLDLEKDNEQIAKEKAQQATVSAAAAASTGSITQQQAAAPGPHLGHTFVAPPIAPVEPALGPKRARTPRPARTLPQTHIGPSPKGPAQSYGPPTTAASTAASSSSAPAAAKAESATAASTAASSSSAPAAAKAESAHLGAGVEEAVADAKAETDKVFEEQAKQKTAREEAIRRKVAADIGANPDFVTRLAQDAGKGNGRPTKGYGPAPPPEKQSTQAAQNATYLGGFFRSMSAGRTRIAGKTASPGALKVDITQHPIPTKQTPIDVSPLEVREAAIRRRGGRRARVPRPASEPAPLLKARSRTPGRETSPPPPPKLKPPPSNDLQLEAARRRRAARAKPPKMPRTGKSPKPEKSPRPEKSPKPTKSPTPKPAEAAASAAAPAAAKAAAAVSAYPTFDKSAAKVKAKTPAIVKAASASSAPAAGPPPAGPAAKAPYSKDMGPEALLSRDPAVWLKQSKGFLVDQLTQRGYHMTQQNANWMKLKKDELVAIILALPLKKP